MKPISKPVQAHIWYVDWYHLPRYRF